MSLLEVVMRQPLVYRLWMSPFADKKFAPVAARNDLGAVRRVLDVGCGPGTNARYFSGADYLGIDLNGEYVRDAERRHGTSPRRRFLAADAARFVARPGQRFDFILVNSFLHHLDEATARSILRNLATLLTPDGHVHILDLVLPESASLARAMARRDRGDFPRPLEQWREIFGEAFQGELELYDLGALGLALWKMVYFKGKARSP